MGMMTSKLDHLEGTWTGTGRAEYPTIMPAEYREELVFTSDHKHPILHYVQRTWKIVPGTQDIDPLFWETGFFLDKGDGIFELASAQQGGRMEILRGSEVITSKDHMVIELKSVSIINDERMIQSQRVFRISRNIFEYEQKMSTKENPVLQIHVSARLTRSRKSEA